MKNKNKKRYAALMMNRQISMHQIKVMSHGGVTQCGAPLWLSHFKRDIHKQNSMAMEQSEVWKCCHMRTAEGAGEA